MQPFTLELRVRTLSICSEPTQVIRSLAQEMGLEIQLHYRRSRWLHRYRLTAVGPQSSQRKFQKRGLWVSSLGN